MKNVQPPAAVGKASVVLTAVLAIALLAAGQNRARPPVRTPEPPPPPQTQAAPAEPNPAEQPPAEILSVRLPPPPAPPEPVATMIAAMTPLPEPAPMPPPEPPRTVPAPEPVARKSPPPLRIEPLAPEPSPIKAQPVAMIRPPLTPETTTKAPEPVPEPAVQPLPPAARTPSVMPASLPVTRETVVEGRTMLRLLEHGEGPRIEIAWPESAAARRALYDRLTRCLGMRTALIDGSQRLFIDDGPAGRPWRLDTDRFSGFMRQPDGALVAGERAVIDRIRARHGGHLSNPVRLFPRRVDAVLLGGLRQAIGGDGGQAIRARYRLESGRILVDAIIADGQAVPGRIDLTDSAGRTCRE
jgi:hypothetical protein